MLLSQSCIDNQRDVIKDMECGQYFLQSTSSIISGDYMQNVFTPDDALK